jgi:hypothetical protein
LTVSQEENCVQVNSQLQKLKASSKALSRKKEEEEKEEEEEEEEEEKRKVSCIADRVVGRACSLHLCKRY